MKNQLFLTLLVLIVFQTKSQNTICFTSVANGPYTNSVIESGDFNGDGYKDVVSSTGTAAVSIIAGNGDFDGAGLLLTPSGTFGVHEIPRDIKVGDLNNDGKDDIVALGQGSVSLLFNNGVGGFSTYIWYSAIGGSARELTLGDFNSDNYLDVALASIGGTGQVSIYLSNSGTALLTPFSYSFTNGKPISLDNADINADGELDIVTSLVDGSQNGIAVAVMFGVGDGSFMTDSVYAFVGGPYAKVRIGDINGDGKKDVAVLKNPYISVFLGDGFGQLNYSSDITNLSSAWVQMQAFRLQDFNNDGYIDILTGSGSTSTITLPAVILRGLGGGSFSGVQSIGSGGYETTFAINDFNNDGRMDVVSGGGTEYVVKFNNSSIFNLSINDTTICTGQQIAITAIGSGPNTYTWSTGSTDSFIVVSPTVSTTYTVTGNSNCASFDSVRVNVQNCIGFESIISNQLNIFTTSNKIKTTGQINSNQKLNIINMLGQTVFTCALQEEITTNLPSGLYNLQVVDANNKAVLSKKVFIGE
jgi:hypothetical protein